MLEETIYRTTANTLLMPLGLHHDDHVLVFEACCEILPRLSHLTWFAYEDAIHRRTPGVVQARLADLAQRGIVATPAYPSAAIRLISRAARSSNAKRSTLTKASCARSARAITTMFSTPNVTGN